ncbi:MAG: D-alanine--D-alanine ligase [Gemmatimonadaceae bacterium]
MTRIGFAYNQKPEPSPLAVAGGAEAADTSSLGDEEPPSTRRDGMSRYDAAPGESLLPAAPATPGASATALAAAPDDEFAEWDSPATIDAVADALSALGTVVRLEATPDFPERLRAERARGLDIVFNIAEGLRGVNREAHVPAICEFFGVPYSGSDPFTLSLCLDKARTKEVLAFRGVPTASFALVHDEGELVALLGGPSVQRGARSADGAARQLELPRGPVHAPRSALAFPLFVKPVHEGSSKGITERNYCETPDELERQVAFLLEAYRQPVLVEEYLPGREFTCAVLGNGAAARVLPIVGMNFGALPEGALPVYGFEAKWLWDRPENPLEMFECPARVGEPLRRAIEDVTLRAYHALGCRDWSRIDVRLDADGVPNVVEVNPLPGILPDPADNSCLPKAARTAGIEYDALIQSCLRHAAARQGVPIERRTPSRGRRS